MDKLSIKSTDEEIEIHTNRADIAASLIKGIIGAAPIVGPIFAETLSATIPNQKIDRVIACVKLLEDKIKYIEGDRLKEKLQSEEFTDLLEDGLNQASRALSDQRKEYIANLLKNGLVGEKQTHQEKKKLFSIVGQLTDAEIIMLNYFSLHEDKEREEFANKHPFVRFIDPNEDRLVQAHVSEELSLSYFNQLTQLGLVSTIIPGLSYTTISGESHHTTFFGDLLLSYIGLGVPFERVYA